MFDIFRWSKNKSKDKNTEKHQNKTKKIENSLTEKYRPLSRDEQETVPVLLPPQKNIEPEVFNHLNSEHIQNKRINKSKNSGKFYFDDDNKTNIALNLTYKRVPAPTPLSMRESEWCANINAGQRETVDSATASPIDVETAHALSKINEISVANRDGDIHSQSKNSRNELAEQQGHELIGNHLLLLKYPEHRLENVSKTKPFPVVKEIGVLETTNPTAIPQEQERSLNEVKVRNKTKTHEIFESKRQSWFGLHFLKNKKNLNENQNTTNRKKADGGPNNFFFLTKSKSNNNSSFAETINKPSATAHFNQVESLLKKPHFEKRLEKRKDFPDDISMARGRNHNRLRNNNHSQQQQHHHHNEVQSPQDNSHRNEKSVAKALCGNNDNMANAPVNVNEDKAANHIVNTLSILHSTHLETTHDPANKSTNSYQITASNNSNRNAESHCAQFRNSEENTISHSESVPDIREEHLLSKAICAEALIQCKKQHFLKDQPQPNFLIEQRNTLTPTVERRAVLADLYLKNSPNTNDQLQLMTKNTDSEIDIKARDCDISSNARTRETDASNKLNELTECDRDRWLRSVEEDVETSVMGQTNGKQEATRITRSSTPREFRDSVISDNRSDIQTANLESHLVIPTITVVDFSHDTSVNNTKGTQNVSSEFKREENEITDSIPTIDVEYEIEAQIIDSSFLRLSHVALDDVPEQEESEDYDNKENAHNVLSTSFPDSGIGLDSLASRLGSPPQVVRPKSSGHLSEQNTDSTNPPKASATYFSKRASSLPMSPSVSSHRMPFIRDGYSTDCDDSLIQCDDYDFASDDNGSRNQSNFTTNERLVCIESISLPDVVVESTANLSNGAHPSLFQSSFGSSEHHVNINGTTGNNMENVHFVPINIEGSNENKVAQKRYSIDDNGINGHRGKSTIKITSEEDDNFCMEYGKNKGSQKDNHTIEKLKCDLVSQESRYNAQLEDAQEKTLSLQTKVNEMQELIDSLEKDLAVKTWNVEKLQAELNAAHKDDEFVRKKLKLLEEEKTNLRHKYCENEEDLQRKYDELEQKYKELEEKYTTTQQLASNLQTQLAGAQSDAQECREQMYEMREEMEEHMRLLKNALENSEAERKIGQDKWQKEFEMLRTHNQDREESLMTDCEWQVRQMQRQCKDKIDKSEYCRREAIDRAELLECAAQERLKEMQQLRLFEAEAKSLRGLTSEQEHSISTLTDQLESLKTDLQMATENLEAQIEAVRRIKYQCDNKIYDKDRELIQRIDYVRNEAASFWENKLYTEMTRLKSELESVFIDERREALNKLQAEHIEELRALTTRYTANEEELRAELAELQERLDHKSSEFLELREKSDSALLQTRMHLDKADRDYQNAMSREEEKREALEESLREEFEAEKAEMEEKFCERIGHVKDEFSRELQMSTQEMKTLHKKELAQQKEKLQAEKDEVMQDLVERHRLKLAAAEDLKKDIELRHQRDLKDLKAAYDAEKASLDKRDISNANEIEQLHRKCRCLTNLFEEMRVRYERRDPRPEDLREISELRSRCESHEHDLYLLTDRLREMQMQMAELQQHGDNISNSAKKTSAKGVKKPPPKTIPTNCDVIYEENEERDSSPPAAVLHTQESDGEEEEDVYENAYEDVTTQATKFKINSQDNNKNRSDLINEDDGHMITAV